MRPVRRVLAAVLLAVTMVVATACAGLPSSSTVQEGLAPDTSSGAPDFSFLPDRPQPGATASEIVEGFIRAGSGPGALGRWEPAREFLAPEFSEIWRPEIGVTVDSPGDRVYSSTDDGTVTLSLVAVATVDDKGSYQRSEVGPTDLPFTLARQDDGEWRITSAPDGIVLDRDIFPSVFHQYAVTYFDPSWQYLVPDVRWFPTANAASRIADALVNRGRNPWLADSVSTAFPESVTLLASVPITDGVAEVELSRAALDADRVTLDRMLTQLTASLAGAGASSVQLTVSASPINAQTVSTRSTRVASAPLVLTDDGLGFLTGDDFETIPGLSAAVTDAAPTAVQVSPDRLFAAVINDDGVVSRVGADGVSYVVDDRPGLVDPTIDPFGVIWTVGENNPGEVRASSIDGSFVDIADSWGEATGISAMAISRDGTRMSAIVTSGGRSVLWVAGVVRNTDGQPVRLSEPLSIGPVAGSGTAVTWLDDTTIGALSGDSEASAVLEQVIGGPSVLTAAAAGLTSIAGGASASVVRVHGDDDAVYVKRSANWEQIATEVRVLATQQGVPQ
jgi:hypothetical protein